MKINNKLPDAWQKKPLSAVLDKIIDYRGQSVPKTKSGVPLITTRNVKKGFLDFSIREYIDEALFEKWMSRGKPCTGDILFTTEAPLGNACRFPEMGHFAIGQRIITLRTKSKILISDYLLYFLLSQFGQQLIDIRSSGSTAKGIKSSEFKKIKIIYPISIHEQIKIAQILSTWDKAIETTERLLSNSQQQKKALMQKLMTGKKRFPGFEEPQLTIMSDFLSESRISGSTGDTAKKITIKLYGKGVFPKDEKRAGSESTKYYLRKTGQFIYSKLDFLNGAFGIIPRELDGCESTLDLPAFDFNGNIDPVWFINYVSRKEFYKANLGLANGGRKARRVNPQRYFEYKVEVTISS